MSCLWTDTPADLAREAARPRAPKPAHRRGVALTALLAYLWPLVAALCVLAWGPR